MNQAASPEAVRGDDSGVDQSEPQTGVTSTRKLSDYLPDEHMNEVREILEKQRRFQEEERLRQQQEEEDRRKRMIEREAEELKRRRAEEEAERIRMENAHISEKRREDREIDGDRLFSLRQMATYYPGLKVPTVEGLVRRGEVCNLIAKPKVGKSWLAYSLAVSVAGGLNWLNRFSCQRGKVLFIDCELQRHTIASRFCHVVQAMGLQDSGVEDRIIVYSLRGFEVPEFKDEKKDVKWIAKNLSGNFEMVIIDPVYRLFPEGASENDPGATEETWRAAATFARKTNAAVVLVHHATKGDQSSKDITDVGSGSGMQSRAADTHLILRQHEEGNCVVMDAETRSFPPIEPVVLRWSYPLWVPDQAANPASLSGSRLAKAHEASKARFEDKRRRVCDYLGSLAAGATKSAIEDATGIRRELAKVLKSLADDGQIEPCEVYVEQNRKSYPGWKTAATGGEQTPTA